MVGSTPSLNPRLNATNVLKCVNSWKNIWKSNFLSQILLFPLTHLSIKNFQNFKRFSRSSISNFSLIFATCGSRHFINWSIICFDLKKKVFIKRENTFGTNSSSYDADDSLQLLGKISSQNTLVSFMLPLFFTRTHVNWTHQHALLKHRHSISLFPPSLSHTLTHTHTRRQTKWTQTQTLTTQTWTLTLTRHTHSNSHSSSLSLSLSLRNTHRHTPHALEEMSKKDIIGVIRTTLI